ncbi:MAG TPA: hypothetical protein VK843_14995 [Planctomycetota bacterium]|nr:hypothetical protein [Planctomycetota bacterium]
MSTPAEQPLSNSPAGPDVPLAIARAPRRPALPLDPEFVDSALTNPLRAIDLTLAEADRVGASVVAGVALSRIAFILLVTSLLFAIPYGCVLSLAGWWKVVALTLGSTVICLPSLFVFSSYLGQRMRLEQILVLGFTIPAVAALFSFGFAPIVAFLRATMSEGDTQVPWRSISNVLLALSVLAGVVQLWRTWLAARNAAPSNLFAMVLLVWHAVFLHVLWRMGTVLHLGG